MKKIGVMSLACLLFLLVASVVPAVAAVVRQPYLQLVTPTSITIVWRTDLNSADNSQVKYGTVSGSLTQTATGTAVTRSGLNVKDHIVTITGLTAGTKYFYNFGTATNGIQGGGTTNHFFVTAPPVGSATPIRAWVLGDSGNASVNQRNVRDAMLTETTTNPPDIILHMGDIAYENGTDAEFTTKHFAVYQDILRQTPIWPTLGNHESPSVNTSLGIGPYYEAHVLPSSGQAGGVASGTEAYYAFDYANVHFIVLDSMDSSRTPGSPMVTWLQNDLASTGQEWVIAFWHHPPYSKGHDSDNANDSGGRLVDMRETILPILEAGGVDLVLAGHSHAYERSYLIDGAYGYGTAPNFATPSFNVLQADGHILNAGNGNPSGTGAYQKSAGGVSHDGTVYVVAGHGGKSIEATGSHPVMTVVDAAFGSVILDITGSNLTFRNLRAGGAITDTVGIVKNSSGAIIAAQDFNIDGKSDIVWRNTSTGASAVWLMNGVNIASTGFPGGASLSWQIAGGGDLNGDGKSDLVWRNTSSGAVSVWFMNGTTITSTGFPSGAPLAWQIAGVGDLNGDGKADLVWRNTSSGAVAVWIMNGTTITSTGFPGSVPLDWVIKHVGDLNGDGKADLVWRKNSTGAVAVWLMNGATISSTGFPSGGSLAWQIAGVGDLNANGTDDIVWRHASSGAVAVWFMNGATITSTGFPGSVSLNWDIRQIGDLNGDGKADLVWHNTGSGTVAVWLMNGATITSTGYPATTSLDWQIQ
ncbi:FG-GAP-like repeat-containing protein [Candidatus Nitrospira allomarina]|uniref:FG-GAP-like repeat-containing protein n=1 Tax=Candidatus Nitrospira allomarina TaxID=3020900 RepID=A0AA96JSD7_9BACT|nr:FG-GAP-like repeat-containing protein [Candidatus Nitrospira allomarina]WNM58153.1 FG-GAP-like repeat-containing protein [Candidatus Nitrospira allomarina]